MCTVTTVNKLGLGNMRRQSALTRASLPALCRCCVNSDLICNRRHTRSSERFCPPESPSSAAKSSDVSMTYILFVSDASASAHDSGRKKESSSRGASISGERRYFKSWWLSWNTRKSGPGFLIVCTILWMRSFSCFNVTSSDWP